MSQDIYIPGLQGAVAVSTAVRFDAEGENLGADLSKEYDATFRLTDKKRTARLWIMMGMTFPAHPNEDGNGWAPAYMQQVTGAFNNIVQADGNLLFSDTQINLQGEPVFIFPASRQNRFRFIDGTAWVSASNNPRIPVVKIKLSIGSQDVDVVTTTKTVTDPVWKESFETGGGVKPGGLVGWVANKFVDIDVKLGVKFERSGQTTVTSTGRTRTVGQLSQQRVWTISLQLPEIKAPPPPPGPFGLPEPYTAYFDTGKSNADRYRSPLAGMMDQIKGLQEYMDNIDKAYGLANIDGATVVGYASGLGDTRGNLNLSTARAQYIVDLISTLRIDVPSYKITPRGAPIHASDKDDNPKDRRAELIVRLKGSARR